MRDARTMVMNGAALELGDRDEQMTIDHKIPCEEVLRNALMNQIGGSSAMRNLGRFRSFTPCSTGEDSRRLHLDYLQNL
jgi:hypothetical protein